MIPLLLAVHALDLGATLAVLQLYGLGAEANPFMAGALALGPLGGIGAKCALLAVILAAAALNARARPFLVGGAFIAGILGAGSGLVALA